MALNGFALPCVAKTRGSRALEPVAFSPFASLIVPSIPIVGLPENLFINAPALATIVN